MENEITYNKRLLKFARYIGKRHLEETLLNRKRVYKVSSNGTNVEHFHWALQWLPKVFKQWQYDHQEIPRLQDYESCSPLMNVANWFGLDADELFHLFLPGYWIFELGGVPLSENSTPSDLAHNIYEFIQCRSPEYDYISGELTGDHGKKKKTKIIKLQNNYYERDYENTLPGMQA